LADNDESRDRDDLSEEASPYKIEEFRRKGKVAQSKELTGIIALMASGVALYATVIYAGEDLVLFVKHLFSSRVPDVKILTSEDILTLTFTKGFKLIGAFLFPIAIVGFILNIVGSVSQIGFIFSGDPIKPDLNKINPVQGFKKFITLKHLYDSIRLLFKGAVVFIIAYFLLKDHIYDSSKFVLLDPNIILQYIGDSYLVIFYTISFVLLIFSGLDFWIQKWDYGKNVRVTRKEAKEEHKQHEGDPLVKSRIRSIQREMSKKRMLEDVKKADVVITNPTHIAIALEYKKEEMMAPKVVAIGADFLAQKIKKVAAENNIPLVENVPLARTLHKSVKVGQFVPRALYQAVAEVLAYVFKLKGQRA